MADFSNQRICSFFPKSDFKVQIVPLSSQPPTYLTHRYSSSGLCASPPEGWSEGRVSSCLKKINFIITIFSTKPISLFLITVLQALFPSVALNHKPNSYFQFLLLPPAHIHLSCPVNSRSEKVHQQWTGLCSESCRTEGEEKGPAGQLLASKQLRELYSALRTGTHREKQ